jgi:hypothetical protein
LRIQFFDPQRRDSLESPRVGGDERQVGGQHLRRNQRIVWPDGSALLCEVVTDFRISVVHWGLQRQDLQRGQQQIDPFGQPQGSRLLRT